jgi:hypothetical protein
VSFSTTTPRSNATFRVAELPSEPILSSWSEVNEQITGERERRRRLRVRRLGPRVVFVAVDFFCKQRQGQPRTIPRCFPATGIGIGTRVISGDPDPKQVSASDVKTQAESSSLLSIAGSFTGTCSKTNSRKSGNLVCGSGGAGKTEDRKPTTRSYCTLSTSQFPLTAFRSRMATATV